MDNFGRFVTLGCLADRKSNTIADWIIKNIIALFGIPIEIRTDNGSEFLATVGRVCEEFGIRHRRITPHHPQANGMAERHIRTVKSFIVRYLVHRN